MAELSTVAVGFMAGASGMLLLVLGVLRWLNRRMVARGTTKHRDG